MAILSNSDTGRELLEILGINPNRVAKVQITMEVGEPITIETWEYAEKEQIHPLIRFFKRFLLSEKLSSKKQQNKRTYYLNGDNQ
jgi:hypothetical protein